MSKDKDQNETKQISSLIIKAFKPTYFKKTRKTTQIHEGLNAKNCGIKLI